MFTCFMMPRYHLPSICCLTMHISSAMIIRMWGNEYLNRGDSRLSSRSFRRSSICKHLIASGHSFIHPFWHPSVWSRWLCLRNAVLISRTLFAVDWLHCVLSVSLVFHQVLLEPSECRLSDQFPDVEERRVDDMRYFHVTCEHALKKRAESIRLRLKNWGLEKRIGKINLLSWLFHTVVDVIGVLSDGSEQLPDWNAVDSF